MGKWALLLLCGLSGAAVAAMSDPTLPLRLKGQTTVKATTKKAAPLPRLEAITCRDNATCSATLNGQLVKAGQTVRGGYKVAKIDDGTVILERRQQRWQLTMFGQNVLQQ
ncbi:MSHA biogenesis protein MshK [Vibrio sp. SM6]|uniref:MSHA biogenesis protein MshK n=1 Tax=Vibrio agarilyticus TaxID=2726741 RepID=A0A7X8TTP0_9VIBR|nr:MSHA biogenesis protein MshK [Vibrio agarilyticus]NLS14595.1 MSHA biogenesis protein MshK [Vibrio agarilyticus]